MTAGTCDLKMEFQQSLEAARSRRASAIRQGSLCINILCFLGHSSLESPVQISGQFMPCRAAACLAVLHLAMLRYATLYHAHAMLMLC